MADTDPSVKCPRCGASNPLGELLCGQCGRALPRPSREVFQAQLKRSAVDERRRRRRDLLVAGIWGLLMGLGILGMAEWLSRSSLPYGTPEPIVELGQQFWWLFGLFYGWVVWYMRR